MLFVVAFSINANAQQANNETMKEACCALSCDTVCCDDPSCDMDTCDAGCCEMAPAGCCISSASCDNRVSAETSAPSLTTQPSRESCAMGESSCSSTEQPIKV